MRGSQKITRINLSVSEEDFPLALGIVTADPDYKISLKLNSKLNINLKNHAPVDFQDKEGNQLSFSRFCDDSKSIGSLIQLVSNRSLTNYLLKKLKNIDYLLLLYDSGKDFDHTDIISRIREIDTITGVFNINLKTLRDPNLKYLI